MVFIIGLGVQGVKYAYKSYKKHQTEKELRGRATPHEIPDQRIPESAMLTGTISTTSTASTYDSDIDQRQHWQQQHRRSPSHVDRDHDHDLKRTLAHRNSSSSSISSASTAEVEASLDNDVEFQRFIAQQKQAYLDQRRSLRTSGRGHGYGSGIDGFDARNTAVAQMQHPPAYDVVMAQSGAPAVAATRLQPARGARSTGRRTPPRIVHPALAELSDDEAFVVSPMTPTSASLPRSEVNEIGTSAVAVPRFSPVGAVCELPAAPHSSSARYPVELPSVAV